MHSTQHSEPHRHKAEKPETTLRRAMTPAATQPDPRPPSPPVAAQSVPWRERIAFGAGGWPAGYGMWGLKSLAIPVYQMTLKVDPAMLGLMLALPRFWDAFSDPLMGHISDRTRSRFGRRRPYIIAGAFLTGLSFALVWMVPVHWPQNGQLAWFLATSLLFYTCFTVWAVPYQSLGYELTANYHERTAVMGVQNIFGKLSGLTIDWLFPLAHLGLFVSVMHGVRTITLMAGVAIFIGLGLLPGLFVRERFAPRPERAVVGKPAGFWIGCVNTLRNRGMLVLITLVTLNLVASMFTSGLDYYLLVYFVCGGNIAEGAMWKGVLSTCFSVIGILAVWPLAWVSKRYDKRNALMIIYGMVAAGGVGKWFFFREGMPWLCVFVPLLCAPIFTANGMIAQSMLADICDDDEWRHGGRREGLFGAMHGWVGKTVASLAIFGAGVTLNLVGFDAARGVSQDPDALLAIRYILVAATTLPALIAIFILRYYPLNEARMADIRRELEARRGAV